MELRLTVGKYAGQVLDVEPVSAKVMLADGRATYACPDQVPAPRTIDGEEAVIQPKAVMGPEFLRGAKRKRAK